MTKYVHHYAYGKLNEARNFMAASPKSLRKRLSTAFIGGLLLIRKEDMPSELWIDFTRLLDMVTSEPPNNHQGSIETTLERMHWTKVLKCACLLVSIVERADHLVDPKFDYRTAA